MFYFIQTKLKCFLVTVQDHLPHAPAWLSLPFSALFSWWGRNEIGLPYHNISFSFLLCKPNRSIITNLSYRFKEKIEICLSYFIYHLIYGYTVLCTQKPPNRYRDILLCCTKQWIMLGPQAFSRPFSYVLNANYLTTWLRKLLYSIQME